MGIANKLGIVVLNDRLADQVCAGGEVDNSRCDGGGITVCTTSISRRNSSVDSDSVIGRAITLSILD